jgi:hypothetical protein
VSSMTEDDAWRAVPIPAGVALINEYRLIA